MAETATEKRLEDLAKGTERGFSQVDHRFGRVEADIREMRTEISGLRSDMKAGDDTLRTEMHAGFVELRGGIDGLRKLMIVFFASTLGTIVAGVAVAVITAHF